MIRSKLGKLRSATTTRVNRLGKRIRRQGSARYCPVCDREAARFEEFGAPPRPDALCPHCGSLERHRLVSLFLRSRTDVFAGARQRVLHFAPEPCLESRFRSALGRDYVTADLLDDRADRRLDITDTCLEDGEFDLVYCSHVLEHVPDDRKALRELRRVLRDTGHALLLVPIHRDTTYEDAGIDTPAARREHFGQEDHVRIYGLDFPERVCEAGFDVEVVGVGDLASAEDVVRMGLADAAGEIFWCSKDPGGTSPDARRTARVRPRYIVGTGWWCDGSGAHALEKMNAASSSQTRQSEFFRLWYDYVMRFTRPEKILVVDSASPVGPPAELLDPEHVEFLSLNQNFGHAFDSLPRGVRSGWSRSVLLGAWYAYLNDVDYFVYVEQDCLVFGEGWLERCLMAMNKRSIMVGAGDGTPHELQQSLFILHRDYIPTFLRRSVEVFDEARRAILRGEDFEAHSDERQWYEAFGEDAEFIPFGVGRDRPFPTGARHFYAQHLAEGEVELFRRLIEETRQP